MKRIFFIYFLLFGILSHAQKQTEQTIDAENIEAIVFSANEIFKITISTDTVEEITIRTHSDGEYFNQISLEDEVLGETLYLNSRFREILQNGYDKLSAHKVFALEVVLSIPEELFVDISSNLASVHASGKFRQLLLQLRSGSCFLTEFSGDAIINTFNGNIEIATYNAELTADSRHGEIEISGEFSGSHKISLSSINGDIRVHKTK